MWKFQSLLPSQVLVGIHPFQTWHALSLPRLYFASRLSSDQHHHHLLRTIETLDPSRVSGQRIFHRISFLCPRLWKQHGIKEIKAEIGKMPPKAASTILGIKNSAEDTVGGGLRSIFSKTRVLSHVRSWCQSASLHQRWSTSSPKTED